MSSQKGVSTIIVAIALLSLLVFGYLTWMRFFQNPQNQEVVPVLVIASDNLGLVKIELWIDQSLYSTDFSSTGPNFIKQYTFTWVTGSYLAGQHTLMVKAYDRAGNIGNSETITVTLTKSGNQSFKPVTFTIK